MRGLSEKLPQKHWYFEGEIHSWARQAVKIVLPAKDGGLAQLALHD